MNCKGCAERVLGCHAFCESYKEYRKKIDLRIECGRRDSVGKGYICSRETKIARMLKNRRGKL